MTPKLIPIYNTKGDAEIFLGYPYLFNLMGEWVGFVTPEREVYSVLGEYVGMLTNDPRILRPRAIETNHPHIAPPPAPPKVSAPPTTPLAPLMPELSQSMIDVLLEEPERLHTTDSGEFKDDMD